MAEVLAGTGGTPRGDLPGDHRFGAIARDSREVAPGDLYWHDAEVTVETYLHVREDALQLYGFADAAERVGLARAIAGGVEASRRRRAHYDYWCDKVRKSILLDCKADRLAFGA